MIDATHGTIPQAQAQRLADLATHPNPAWTPGDTEPWIIDAVCALLRASGQTVVLELGGYTGACSEALLRTLDPINGLLTVVEHNHDLCCRITERLYWVSGMELTPTNPDDFRYHVIQGDTVGVIPGLDDRSIGFCWVDDSHDTPHVAEELALLIPKMVDGGIICFHDVCGAYRLHGLVSYYGGYSLDLPRVSSSGGLGILQVRPSTRLVEPIPSSFWTRPAIEQLPDGSMRVCVLGDDDSPP